MGVKCLFVSLWLALAAQFAAGASPSCSSGIVGYLSADKKACCPASCGRCGGANCHLLPGGAAKCCGSTITAWCSVAKKAPCLLGAAPTAKPTPKPTPKPTGGCGIKCKFTETPCGRFYSTTEYEDEVDGRKRGPDDTCCSAEETCVSYTSDKIGGSSRYSCKPACTVSSCGRYYGGGECIFGTESSDLQDGLYKVGCKCNAGFSGPNCQTTK